MSCVGCRSRWHLGSDLWDGEEEPGVGTHQLPPILHTHSRSPSRSGMALRSSRCFSSRLRASPKAVSISSRLWLILCSFSITS